MKKFFIVLSVFIFFTTCKKDKNSNDAGNGADLTKNVDSISQMKVPEGFLYQATRKVPVTIQVANSAACKVQLFDGNPISNGDLLASGIANNVQPFTAQISIPSALDVVYLVVTDPNNISQTTILNATGSEINISNLGKRGSNQSLQKSQPASPDCLTGCTQTVTGNNSINLNNANSVVCVTGNFNGSIDINRGTVRICGNAVISNCNLNNDAILLIARGASVTFNSININGQNSIFRNWSSSVTISGTFSPGGQVTNYGNLTINGQFNVNGQAVVLNEGNLSISGALNNNKTITNNGSLAVQGAFAQNGGGVFTNNCRFTVGQTFTLNNPLQNNSYIAVTGSSTINGGGVLTMSNAAMFTTNGITINNIIQGTGTRSLVKVVGNTTINGGGRLNGNLQYCDANGIETNTGVISGTVEQACNLYIQTTSCNPEGNGTILIPDTDNDGVNDSLDEYPTNPLLAFNNYFPTDTTFATVAFEDLWPSKGDYDLNDLVVDLRHNLITNAAGNVARFEGSYKLRAAGGAQKLAFCMQFPFSRNSVQNASGATIETNQENLVMNLFENSKTELAFWNTVLSQPQVAPKTYAISFNITNGASLASLGGVNEFDPFIWINEPSKGRGYEVHLPGKPNTPLANTSVFGYADDASKIGSKYYLSKTNLPWAILIPETFTYCQELRMLADPTAAPDITQVYLHFAQWVQSGGAIYKDWYMDKPGYRNTEYLYIK
jgi:LruC domain-containing protein